MSSYKICHATIVKLHIFSIYICYYAINNICHLLLIQLHFLRSIPRNVSAVQILTI